MQKYGADKSEQQSDSAIVWYSVWKGGEPLAKINNCRLATMAGNMRRTVYMTAEPDTWFSIPAVCRIAGCRVSGYVTYESNGCLVFNHTYY